MSQQSSTARRLAIAAGVAVAIAGNLRRARRRHCPEA
jgi:hypothetical protein